MSQEIFERPNRATGPREVWERYGGCELLTAFLDNGILRVRRLADKYYVCDVECLEPSRYRIRTLDEKPWPEAVTVEKRRVIQYRWMQTCYVVYASIEGIGLPETAVMLSDEIRDCEVLRGEVVRVLPPN